MAKSDRAEIGKEARLPDEVQESNDRKAEKILQKQIMGWLEIRGIFAGCQRMDKKSTLRRGWADIVCAVHGWPLALECKSATGKQTGDQIEAMNRLIRDGWIFRLVRSLEEVVSIVNFLAECPRT